MTAHDFIYLASKSARRRELLTQVGVSHRVLQLSEGESGEIDETALVDEAAPDYVVRLARLKAHAGWMKLQALGLSPQPLLSADTTVELDSVILGKPIDVEDATAMLQSLSGKVHHVHTAIAVRMHEQTESALSSTAVRFRTIDAEEIARYVRSGEPMDKAGSYAIQGRAAAFVEHLSGSYSGVVGLPLFETLRLLNKFGVNIP
jgi:septum formation protein